MVKTFHHPAAPLMSLEKTDHRTGLLPLGLSLILILTSCSVLTKSQLDSIKLYAVATQEYADYPGQVIKDYVEVQNSIFLLTSPLIANPQLAGDRLFSHQKSKAAILAEAERLDLSFEILKEYAKNLEVLSDPEYFSDIGKNTENTGIHLDQLIESYNGKFNQTIPGGLGSLVYQALMMAGKRYLDKKRGDILKEYLSKGEVVIKEISGIGKAFLEEKVAEEWIEGLDLELKSAHSAVRTHILVDTLHYPSNTLPIIQIDTQVAGLYGDIHQLSTLNQHLITSLEELYAAHQAINLNVQQKIKLPAFLNEVGLFVGEVYEIIDLFKTLEQE